MLRLLREAGANPPLSPPNPDPTGGNVTTVDFPVPAPGVHPFSMVSASKRVYVIPAKAGIQTKSHR